MSQNTHTTESGFTLVETLVSLFIFVSAVVVMVVITASGINNANLAKNRLTANYLAQEGVELVRNMRDTHTRYHSGGAWDEFVAAMTDRCGGGGCDINPNVSDLTGNNFGAAITSCGSSGCQPLRLSNSGYGWTGDETQFRRRIRAQQLQQGNELAVQVVVTWQQGGRQKQVEVREHLFNWVTPSPSVQ